LLAPVGVPGRKDLIVRKVTLLIGVGVGFVLGSRAGRGPYEQIEAKARELTGRQDVRQVVDTAKSGAASTAHSIADRLPGSLHRSRGQKEPSVARPDFRPDTYADPQDLQFGAAAAEKEATLDAVLATGESAETLQGREGEPQHGEGARTPRPANKAEPVDDTKA